MAKNEVMKENESKLTSGSIDMSKPIQDLFDECLNFISLSNFEIQLLQIRNSRVSSNRELTLLIYKDKFTINRHGYIHKKQIVIKCCLRKGLS